MANRGKSQGKGMAREIQGLETQAFLAAIVESSDDAIIGKTLEGTVVSWNASAERIYGFSPEEIVGRSVSVLVPPGRPDEVRQILEKMMRGEGCRRSIDEKVDRGLDPGLIGTDRSSFPTQGPIPPQRSSRWPII